MRQQFGRVALFASAGLALAACTTTGDMTPAYPISQPAPPTDSALPAPPPYRPEPIPVDPPPMTAPTETVTSQPLPPPAAAPAPIPEEPPIPQPPPYTPPPPPPPVAAPPVIVTSVTGRVVDVDGPPQVHTVKKGDTVDAIAREFNMTRKEVGELNDLDPPYDKLKLGQKIKGPKTKVKAYVVGQGDTLFAISQRFKVTQKALLDANDMKAGATIRANQRIILPKGYKDGGPIRRAVPAPTPAPSRAATTAPYTPSAAPPAPYTLPPPPAAAAAPAAAPAPYTPPRTATPAPAPAATSAPPIGSRPAAPPLPAPAARPAPAPSAPASPIVESSTAPTDADVVAAGRNRFTWPVKGETIAGFGPKGPGGQRSDGLNIRAAAGEPVRAAAAGEVVYAGDQVPEFGNLVLIKHADGWVTAYAHLGRADVKMRQMVVQGQQVGAVGTSGGVTEPQLHFEVRYAPTAKDKARPIDPTLVLPK
jgi:murein DD-endopeptidase MepM/ murein hydrolase activator NlpD